MVRSGRDGRGRLGSRTLVVLAVVGIVGLSTLSGVMAPAGPVDVSLPLVGSDGDGDGGAGTPATPLASNGTDTDGDGLSDDVEAEIGTDPGDPDTDGDGYPDGMEVGCGDALPGADPLRQDVYVEVDSVEGVSLSDGAVDRLEEAFADAPVENPGGEDGITLHLVESDDDLPEEGPVNNRNRPGEYTDIADYRTGAFDNAELGYHYLLVVSDAAYNGDASFAGAGHRGNVVVENYDRDGVMASLVMHELGHAFGLTHRQEGIDDQAYDLSEYHSVMSYNGIYEVMTYSDGEGDVERDEWDYVADDRHKPATNCPDGDCLSLCSAGA